MFGARDKMTGALIGVCRAIDGNQSMIMEDTDRLIVQGLSALLAIHESGSEVFSQLTEKLHAEKNRIVPDCSVCMNPCGHNDDPDMDGIWNAENEVSALKSALLSCISEAAAHMQAAALPAFPAEDMVILYRALFAIGDYSRCEDLLPLLIDADELKRKYISVC